MDVFAGVISLYPTGGFTTARMFDAPEPLTAHATASYFSLYHGVITRTLPDLKFYGLLNPTALAPEQILCLLRMDLSGRVSDDFDRRFLDAAERVAGGLLE